MTEEKHEEQNSEFKVSLLNSAASIIWRRLKSGISSINAQNTYENVSKLIQTSAALTAIIFFTAWLMEADARREDRILQSLDTKIKTEQIIELERSKGRAIGFDDAINYKIHSAINQPECFLDASGLAIKSQLFKDTYCRLETYDTTIHSSVLQRTMLKIYDGEKPVVDTKTRNSLARVDMTRADLSENESTRKYPHLNFFNSALDVVGLDGDVALINSVSIGNGHQETFLGGSDLFSISSFLHRSKGSLNALISHGSYFRESELTIEGTSYSIIENSVLDRTSITITPENVDAPIFLLLRNVCVINDGGIEGVVLPECIASPDTAHYSFAEIASGHAFSKWSGTKIRQNYSDEIIRLFGYHPNYTLPRNYSEYVEEGNPPPIFSGSCSPLTIVEVYYEPVASNVESSIQKYEIMYKTHPLNEPVETSCLSNWNKPAVNNLIIDEYRTVSFPIGFLEMVAQTGTWGFVNDRQPDESLK